MAKKKYTKVRIGGQLSTPVPSPGTSTIILTQTRRGNLDVGDYMRSVRLAEHVDFPSRAKLLDIHDESLTDAHLYAVIQKRKAPILNTPIEFKRNGVVDELITEQLRSPWFRRFIGDLLDTKQHGNSLFQFRREGKWINYDMIPRKHYDPVRRLILKRQGDIIGDSFEDYEDLLLVGDPRDLGLLTKAALYVIYKRNAFSDFAQFVELYGHPLTEATYDAWDKDMRQKLTDDLADAGGSRTFVHPVGTTLLLHDNPNKGATGELFRGFMTFCNDEISKLELGNTLTTEAGEKGTQALGTVHQSGEDKITLSDKLLVLDVLNYDLADIFAHLGFNTQGGEFDFSVPQNKDLSARIAIDVQLKQSIGLPMSDDYFYDTYGVEKPEDYDQLKKLPAPQATKPDNDPVQDEDLSPEEKIEQKKETTLKNRLTRFFAAAPGKGALKW